MANRRAAALARAAWISIVTVWSGRCCRAAISRASTGASAQVHSTGRRRPGQHCPEGWAMYPFPGPQFQNLTDGGSAESAYYVWVDQFNTLGLGENVPVATGQRQRRHAGAGRRPVRHPARCLIPWDFSPRVGRPHRRSQGGLEGPRLWSSSRAAACRSTWKPAKAPNRKS